MSRALLFVLVTLLAGGATGQSRPGLVAVGGGTLKGCFRNHADANEREGQLRLVSDPARCAATESPVAFNVQGPAGPRGAAGPAGVMGPVGPEGPAGQPGGGLAPGDLLGYRHGMLPGYGTYLGLHWFNQSYPLTGDGNLTQLGPVEEAPLALPEGQDQIQYRFEFGAEVSCANRSGAGVRAELWLQVWDADHPETHEVTERVVQRIQTGGVVDADFSMRGTALWLAWSGNWRYRLLAMCRAIDGVGPQASVGTARKVHLRHYYEQW